jgi:hypothetical protein
MMSAVIGQWNEVQFKLRRFSSTPLSRAEKSRGILFATNYRRKCWQTDVAEKLTAFSRKKRRRKKIRTDFLTMRSQLNEIDKCEPIRFVM